MPVLQSTLPWGAVPFTPFGTVAPGWQSHGPSVAFGQPGINGPIAYLVQQLQQLQQAEYVQQQQLQIVQQLLQVIPQQIQQLQAVLPYQVAQIVQQLIAHSTLGSPGFGAVPFTGLATGPLQSAPFGLPITPGSTTPYAAAQQGYVM
jgi:hypothetical protein